MYIAQQKAIPLLPTLKKEEVLITADTLIWFEGEAIGKPKDYADAFQTLSRFSGHSHEVITAVCLTTTKKQGAFYDTTLVTFANLTPEMIDYYLTHYQPYDKEGREIFVGDVLQIDFVKAIVRFGKYRYYEEKKVLSGNGFYLECLNVMDPDCISPYEPDVLDKAEIIGNIFENPTLEYHFIGLRPK